MIRSKNFETQELREIGLRVERLTHFMDGNTVIEDIFQMEKKECNNQPILKMCKRKSMPKQGRCFDMG